MVEVGALIDRDRKMLERLAAEGKSTRILDEELGLAKELDGRVVFLVGAYAVITPKGRHLLADLKAPKAKPPKPPFGFLE